MSVTVVSNRNRSSTNEQLSVSAAADILNVSESYLQKLLDSGDIPHTKSGDRYFILSGDLHAYKTERDEKCDTVLNEMIKLDCEKGYL